MYGFVYIDTKVTAKSNIASRWVQWESNLMFTLSSDKNERTNSLSSLLSVNVNELNAWWWTLTDWDLNKLRNRCLYQKKITMDGYAMAPKSVIDGTEPISTRNVRLFMAIGNFYVKLSVSLCLPFCQCKHITRSPVLHACELTFSKSSLSTQATLKSGLISSASPMRAPLLAEM